jgi:hypothetical protein
MQHRAEPVRGTQSFVHTLSACWRRPSVTALEVLWRWACGIPALLLLGYEARRVLSIAPLDVHALESMSLLDPVPAAATVAQAAAVILPPLLAAARWVVPLLVVVWAIGAGLGRTAVLRRADPELYARPGTLTLLSGARILALLTAFAIWFLCIRYDAQLTVNGPVDAGTTPDLVLYFTVAIVVSLAMFTLWGVVSWWLSAAPLLAMRRNIGPLRSLAAAIQLGPVRSKLIEINLVMGIVKIALIVLAMVLSACPLPFESIATPQFMFWWYGFVTILYFIASDLFHVVQLVSYLDLWREVKQH